MTILHIWGIVEEILWHPYFQNWQTTRLDNHQLQIDNHLDGLIEERIYFQYHFIVLNITQVLPFVFLFNVLDFEVTFSN